MNRQGERGVLEVVTSQGSRQRFLRGIVTHDLLQRGLDFDSAYAVARAVRGRLDDREEVETAEIRDLIAEELDSMFGGKPPRLTEPLTPPEVVIVDHGSERPFSRGLMAQSLYAAGLDLDRAYRLVGELLHDLREAGESRVPRPELARRTADLLEKLEGKEPASRYRLMRRIRRLPRPLVVYVGGASGTGKSTLALELAPLLRIQRINATDTIRQVMRMVFSKNVLPALYSSSFEVVHGVGEPDEPAVSPHDPDFGERLLASFTEQATRVNVGVRAVVERAIAENMSVMLEGVHLYPPLVPFSDLEGAAYQVAMVLGTQEEEIHRSRFLDRARLGGRRAERYLENFAAIRIVQDHVLHQAEAHGETSGDGHEVALVDTSYGDPPVERTLRIVTGVLRRRLPFLDSARWEGTESLPPALLLIIDGLADRPVRALGGRTPLAAANTPTLDRLAREGRCGLADPVSPGVVPDTAAGSLALFGQSPLAMSRGPVEALGAGLELLPGDIALRGNFATMSEEGTITDRRAGRIRGESTELAAVLDRMPLPGSLADEVEVRVRAATEHRLAITLRGEALSSAIRGSDPGEGMVPGPALTPRAEDPEDPRAVYTASVLAIFEQEAHELLEAHPLNVRRRQAGLPPANAILTRGAGRVHRLAPLEEAGVPLRLTAVGGDQTVLGLASWLGATIERDERMTANLDTDLDAKFESAARALSRSDLVIIHVKGADIAAHDQRPDLKMEFLERLDAALARFLETAPSPLRIAVGSDHATLSESGQHAADPLPVLIWGAGIEADSVQTYDESSVASGALHRFPLQLLLGRLFSPEEPAS